MLIRIIQRRAHYRNTKGRRRISPRAGKQSDSAEREVDFAERSGSSAESSVEPRGGSLSVGFAGWKQSPVLGQTLLRTVPSAGDFKAETLPFKDHRNLRGITVSVCVYIYIYVLFVDFTPAGAEAVWSRALIGGGPSVLASRKFLILEGTSRSFSWAVKAAAPVEIRG